MKAHYSWRDIPSLLRTPVGRMQLLKAPFHRCWPLLQRLAMIYRRMALRHTCIVAVTGSFGKTTTARAISVALGGADADVSSYNFKSSVALAVLRIPPWRRFAVIEAGIDGPGQMIQYARMIRPGRCRSYLRRQRAQPLAGEHREHTSRENADSDWAVSTRRGRAEWR